MDLINLANSCPSWLLILIIFFGSLIEYIFPPFPGDSLTISAGYLVAKKTIAGSTIFTILALSSVIGCLISWNLGKHGLRLLNIVKTSHIKYIETNYKKWGTTLLIVNRFIPGLRGTIIIALGCINAPLKPILLWGTFSSMLWNSILVGMGYTFSDSVEKVLELFESYGKGIYIITGLILVTIFIFKRKLN